MISQLLKTVTLAAGLLASSGALKFVSNAGGMVHGTVTPPASGLRAFLFSSKDTLAVNVVSGSFKFTNVKAGSYKLLIEAAPPYRNGVKEGITVVEADITDAGEIELIK